MAESLESGVGVKSTTTATGSMNHINPIRPSQLAGGLSSSGSSQANTGSLSSSTATPGIRPSAPTVPVATTAGETVNAPSGSGGTNNTSTNPPTAGPNNPQSTVGASTCKGAPTSSGIYSGGGGGGISGSGEHPSVTASATAASSTGSPSVHRPAIRSFRRSSAAVPIQTNRSSPPPYSWIHPSQRQPASSAGASVTGSSYPLDEPDQSIEGAGYNWSARNQATWSGPVPLLVRRVSSSGATRYGSLNRRNGSHPLQQTQHQQSSSLRLVNGALAGGAASQPNNGYPSSDEELTSPQHRRLHQQQQQPLLGGAGGSGGGRSDDYDGSGGVFGGGSGGGYSCGFRTCSDSLVTALEYEASTSSFVPDYLVADDMNFINKDNMAGGGGSSTTGSGYVAGGGRVHFSNSATGGDDVSLYGTPKEEAGPGPGPANMGGEPKPSFIRNQLQALFQPTDNKLAMKLFGSKKALMKERIRQKAAGHWIIHPCSNFRLVEYLY